MAVRDKRGIEGHGATPCSAWAHRHSRQAKPAPKAPWRKFNTIAVVGYFRIKSSATKLRSPRYVRSLPSRRHGGGCRERWRRTKNRLSRLSIDKPGGVTLTESCPKNQRS